MSARAASAWINGRKSTRIDYRDRGLQYGDGVFETMRVRGGRIRLLDYHLERLFSGCRRLALAGPSRPALHRELERIAAGRDEAVLKLILTRGASAHRGYRPTGRESCTRIVSVHDLPRGVIADGASAQRLRLCRTPLGWNPRLAGLKTLNRLESVLARAEWKDARVWEGLMLDADENIVCGTMSNLFIKRGSALMTPVLDRCGVAGVMRRWILESSGKLGLMAAERRIRWKDLREAEEVFMSNAVVGLRSVGSIRGGAERLRYSRFDTADRLRGLLERL
jgi:4-amino-4-deoxychorismate lyase